MSTDFDHFLSDLPIFEYKTSILDYVDNNQVTIITAETGAGKSTQVPQYLAEHGYRKVIVTQPRILAARNLSSRVREEYSWRIGEDATSLVGYRTAHERDDDPENTILYCTDGLQLVRELTGSGVDDKQVLILDEIHEWNENMEVLIAWSKKRCEEDSRFKVVLMSATIEADDLAAYFGTVKPINIPGRMYDVEKRHGTDIVAEILQQIETKVSNMLVFLPGKAEIENIADILKTRVPQGTPIIPLHSQLEPDIQQLAFGSYPKGKIVLSTNVAQTSVTIDDIDVVIDSGLERRSEVRSGVEGLFLAEVSQADCLQRAGRAGRTKEGLYILAQLDVLPCSKLEDRDAYGVPEILRKHIDRLVLRLANIGLDIEDLDFYHSPSKNTIKLAKSTLVSLGALSRDGTVTENGRRMERFPVESTYARMLVEAESLPISTQAKLASIIAIQEVGGIVKGGVRYTGWRKYTKQKRSDLLAQYDVYLAVPMIPSQDYEDLGLISKNISKTEEVSGRLHSDLGLGEVQNVAIMQDEEEPLMRCITAGQLHQLWRVEPSNEAVHISSGKKREVSSGTVVKDGNLVAATPFDLQIPTASGVETLHLVNDLTAVKPEWLAELAPDRFDVRKGGVYFDSTYGTMVEKMRITFDGHTFESVGSPIFEYTAENKKQFIRLYCEWLHERIEKERQTLKIVNSRHIPSISINDIRKKVEPIIDGEISVLNLSKSQRIELSKLMKLDAYLNQGFLASLRLPRTHRDDTQHRRRGFWKPRHKRHDR